MVALLSISLVWGLDLHSRHGIEIIGVIKKGWPPFTAPWWVRMNQPLSILRTAAVTVFVGILEAISIAKALGEKHGYQIDPEKELRGASYKFYMSCPATSCVVCKDGKFIYNLHILSQHAKHLLQAS